MRKIAYRPRAMADLERILVYLAVESQAPQVARQAAAKTIDAIEPAAQNAHHGAQGRRRRARAKLPARVVGALLGLLHI